ncbi:MAG: hypothetical protein MJZ74_01130 [Muribaculaceae bacterium]|nr:hypothetical protein [Muribaculaceae bacterium]
MKSLRLFMHNKHISKALRCSLENFGQIEYVDKQDGDAVRQVTINPLYAISNLFK